MNGPLATLDRHRHDNRPRARRGLARSAAVALLLITGSTVWSPPANAENTLGQVGTWSATVTRPDGTNSAVLTFLADHSMCLTTATSHGSGWWSSTDDGTTFSYQAREYLDSGPYVDINQNGELSGNTFSSTGIGTVYSANGTLIRQSQTTVTATRSATTPSC